MTLRLRLGLMFAFATAVAIAVVGLGFVLQLRASLDATLDDGLRARAATLADQYAGAGVATLNLTQNDQPAQLLSGDGRILASSPGLDRVPLIDRLHGLEAQRRTAAGTDPLVFTTGPTDERTRYLVTALAHDPPVPDAILVVGAGAEVSDTADEHVEFGFLVLGPPAVVMAGLAAWMLAGAALRPVERMRRQTAEISEHDGSAHLAVPATRDEVAALGHTMNDLLDRLRGALDHERGFVTDASHELRTPLATLRAELELADRPGRSIDDLQAAVSSARTETERLTRLAEDLLLLARYQSDTPVLRRDLVDVVDVVAVSARRASATADPRGIDIVVEGARALEVSGDRDRLRQVIDNLLANALRHSPDRRAVTIAVTRTDAMASITVADDGPGFPADFLPHAFERFRRADSARARVDGGNGLGLAIVRAIVDAHHGQVTASNRPAGGAVVEVVLPVTRPGETVRDGDDRTGPPSEREGRDDGPALPPVRRSGASALGAPRA